jgi:hypothetical protein
MDEVITITFSSPRKCQGASCKKNTAVESGMTFSTTSGSHRTQSGTEASSSNKAYKRKPKLVIPPSLSSPTPAFSHFVSDVNDDDLLFSLALPNTLTKFSDNEDNLLGTPTQWQVNGFQTPKVMIASLSIQLS